MNNKLACFELPSTSVNTLKHFYANLFGWTFQDFGPDYAAFSEGLDGGFNADVSKTKAPLAIIETDNIDEMEQRIQAEGGTITFPIFNYPGGRRFHFLDPEANELAVMQTDYADPAP